MPCPFSWSLRLLQIAGQPSAPSQRPTVAADHQHPGVPADPFADNPAPSVDQFSGAASVHRCQTAGEHDSQVTKVCSSVHNRRYPVTEDRRSFPRHHPVLRLVLLFGARLVALLATLRFGFDAGFSALCG